MKKETYASSGVQIDKAENFVERIKKTARRAGHSRLWKAAGGYAAVYPLAGDTAVAVTTDGIGTKLLVANELKKFDTIGIDLVAMCANDLICVGAVPTLFLDYYAMGVLEDELSDELIKGIVEGCDRAGMILAGGETAEMPGLYEPGHYDFAGFAVGSVERSNLLTGEEVRAGQALIAVASSGIHSNGLSLARKVVPKEKWGLLLEPTAIYVKATVEALTRERANIKGIAHITGGGWRNLLRLNEAVGFFIDELPTRADIFSILSESVEEEEMYKTFNMGMGLAVIVDESAVDAVLGIYRAHGHDAKLVGGVNSQAGQVSIRGCKFVLKDKHS